MVFSNSKLKSTHHNKLNLRDKSSDPSNLFGDRNLPREETDVDLNDREVPIDLPNLEEAHVPHNERKARAAASKDSRQPKSNFRSAAQ